MKLVGSERGRGRTGGKTEEAMTGSVMSLNTDKDGGEKRRWDGADGGIAHMWHLVFTSHNVSSHAGISDTVFSEERTGFDAVATM